MLQGWNPFLLTLESKENSVIILLFLPPPKKNYKAGVEARDCLELRAAFASSLSSA